MTKKNILLCSVMTLFLWTACSEAEKYQYPFQNPKLKVEVRVLGNLFLRPCRMVIQWVGEPL